MLRDDMHFSHDSISRIQFVPKHLQAPPPDEEGKEDQTPDESEVDSSTQMDREEATDESTEETAEESEEEEPLRIEEPDEET